MHNYLDGAPRVVALADIAYTSICWAIALGCIGAAWVVWQRRRDP